MPAAPSLLIVPYRSKTGKLYSQIPTSGAGDFTVTRNTEARRFNSAGLIESVASGIPRLDYYTSGGTAGCPALLVEPAGTNLALQSENFLTTWAQASLVITTGFTSPSNNANGTLIEADANTGRLRQTIAAITSGTTHTFSLFAKAGNLALASGVSLTIQEGTSTNFVSGVVQSFRLDTGTLGASGTLGAGFTLTRASIENYGNGWYRCNMTVTASYTPASAHITVRPTSTIVSNLPATVSGGTAYIWGAQLETGSVATSYIPTTAGTGSRSGDLVSVSGAVSGSIGQTAGTFYIDLSYSLRSTSTATRWFQVFGSSNNIGLAVATSNVVRSIVNGQSDILSTPSTSDGVKIAWGYDGSGVVCFVNGTQYTLTNGGAQIITQLNQISLDLSTTTNIGNCRLRAMALYTTRLTNDELQSLTTL